MFRGDTGILIETADGTVIGYDETGLVLRLSDRTVESLRRRLGARDASGRIDPAVLGDVDAWNVAADARWYYFDAKLPAYPHPRRFRRARECGDIVADAPGPVLAMLSLGGARRAEATDGPSAFPCHVLAPGDDIGAVGTAGTEDAPAVGALQHLPEQTVDALAASALLARRAAAGRALPLMAVRCETDASGSAAELAGGRAVANLKQAMRNIAAGADGLGTRAQVVSVALDFAIEDTVSGADAYVAAMHVIMDDLATFTSELQMRPPVFLIRADETGTRVREHWALAMFPGGHDLVFTAPGTMFDWDAVHRPTPRAMAEIAAMEAFAVEARESGEAWHCPRLLLAESDATLIRVTCEAATPLVLDPGEGDCGFELSGEGAPKVSAVRLGEDDPASVLITFDRPVPPGVELRYGVGRRGSLRDGWSGDAAGRTLHRWALPAILPVHPC